MVTYELSPQEYPTLKIERVAQAKPWRAKNVKIEVRGYAVLWAVCERAGQLLKFTVGRQPLALCIETSNTLVITVTLGCTVLSQ